MISVLLGEFVGWRIDRKILHGTSNINKWDAGDRIPFGTYRPVQSYVLLLCSGCSLAAHRGHNMLIYLLFLV